MKKSTSSQPQTLKRTLGIISLLIAAMTFNSCEKMEMYPEQLSGSPEGENIKQMPDINFPDQQTSATDKINPLSEDITQRIAETNQETHDISATDKINPVSKDITNRIAEINPEAQDISSEIKPDSEYRPNHAGYIMTDTTTTIAVDPRD